MRVLVTDAEVRKSLAVVRGLGQRHHVLTASASRPAMAAWSKYSSAHLRYRWDEGFPDWLVATVQEHEVDALVCPQEKSMVMAGEVYDRLEAAGTRVTFPRLPVIDRAFDKAKTLAIAREVGIPIPRTAFLDHPSDAAAAAREIGFPLIVKQRYSSYRTGGKFIASEETQYARRLDELDRIIEGHDPELPLPLLQEFVPGSGLGVFLLIDTQGNWGIVGSAIFARPGRGPCFAKAFPSMVDCESWRWPCSGKWNGGVSRWSSSGPTTAREGWS